MKTNLNHPFNQARTINELIWELKFQNSSCFMIKSHLRYRAIHDINKTNKEIDEMVYIYKLTEKLELFGYRKVI